MLWHFFIRRRTEERRTPGGRSYFVNHLSRTTTWIDPRTGLPSGSPLSPDRQAILQRFAAARDALYGPLPSGWQPFLSANNEVFFVDHNTRFTTWYDPRLHFTNNHAVYGANHPTVSQFHATSYDSTAHDLEVWRRLARMRTLPEARLTPGTCRLSVRRESAGEDACRKLAHIDPADMKRSRLVVDFVGDGNGEGSTDELLMLAAVETFDQDLGFFRRCSDATGRLEINPESQNLPEYLESFRSAGRLMALSVLHQCGLGVQFSGHLYKLLLGLPLSLTDLEFATELHAAVQRIANSQLSVPISFTIDSRQDLIEPSDAAVSYFLSGLGQTAEADPFTDTVEPTSLTISEENKDLFVDLIVHWRLVGAVEAQTNALLAGFHDLLPQTATAVFSVQHLESLLDAVPSIDASLQPLDLADLRRNTSVIYSSASSVPVDDPAGALTSAGAVADSLPVPAADPTLDAFWAVVESWDAAHRSRLLRFATGTARLPAAGFAALQDAAGPRPFTLVRLRSTPPTFRLMRKPPPPEIVAFPEKNTLVLPHFTDPRRVEGSLLRAIDLALGEEC
ncbi:neural precursor cell expressed, developmentally down-regulated [Cladochytrium tenue]|nr:neural precursor cell expressed, developmentally down-regulated [Cladochytrium tenue]